ncbi:GNAT family N-acetyltransferase [Photobacterium sp. MCCC 1A19761]|uniref:GNAT family N-acetyltransferase n=1 Tax=Photobacterium sp. MCCC 1A19761 TaxID=3115000 RepID=UPI00307FC257
MEIRLAQQKDLPGFFEYLAQQLKENGSDNTALFHPLSRDQLELSDAMKSRFRDGMDKVVGENGWRQIWLAVEGEQILGHIDLRHHDEPNTQHRALLGMGVSRLCRGQGLGKQLIRYVVDWAATHSAFEHLDLWVLSTNAPACRLYEREGFTQCASISDMYRIDGRSVSYLMMTRSLHQPD